MRWHSRKFEHQLSPLRERLQDFSQLLNKFEGQILHPNWTAGVSTRIKMGRLRTQKRHQKWGELTWHRIASRIENKKVISASSDGRRHARTPTTPFVAWLNATYHHAQPIARHKRQSEPLPSKGLWCGFASNRHLNHTDFGEADFSPRTLPSHHNIV